MTAPKGGVDPILSKASVDFAAKEGTIDEVVVVDDLGHALPEETGSDGLAARWKKTPQKWSLTGVLAPARTYEATVSGQNADGVVARKTFTFSTSKAPMLEARMNPGDDQTVGVGMPVQIRFSRAVPDRKVVERRLKISTTPKVEGSWGWTDDETVLFRPKSFWPAGTKVSAALDVEGHHLGKGVFGGTSRSVHFEVGRDLRMNISNGSKTMTVVENGKTIESLPVSMGRPGPRTTTRSGTKIVYEKQTPYTMRGDSVDPYETKVKHAQRITDSGEFLHGAPWSVSAQGRRNVSHGCVNLAPGAAAWLYGKTMLGDPVVTTGTGRETEPWNGLGSIWNYSWPEWQKRSAL